MLTPSLVRTMLVTSGAIALSGFATTPPAIAQSTPDQARIVSVEPAALTRGVPTTVRVQIEVTLASLDSGLVRIGFNDRGLDRFVLTDSARVERGVHRVTLHSEIIPVDWGARGQLQVFVALGPPWPDNHAPWMPLFRLKMPLKVVP